jgi:hypothetical protein
MKMENRIALEIYPQRTLNHENIAFYSICVKNEGFSNITVIARKSI